MEDGSSNNVSPMNVNHSTKSAKFLHLLGGHVSFGRHPSCLTSSPVFAHCAAIFGCHLMQVCFEASVFVSSQFDTKCAKVVCFLLLRTVTLLCDLFGGFRWLTHWKLGGSLYIQVSILCIIILDILVILHPCSMLSRWPLAFYSQNIWSQLMHTQNLLDQRLFGHVMNQLHPVVVNHVPKTRRGRAEHPWFYCIEHYWAQDSVSGPQITDIPANLKPRGQQLEGCGPVNSYWSFVVMKNGIQLLGPCVSLFAWTERC